jgi:hypothetical protein
MKKLLVIPIILVSGVLLFQFSHRAQDVTSFTNANFAKTVNGVNGQELSASKFESLTDGETVTVTGKNYDNTIGIYVTYCVVPEKGTRPDACGPFDITGKNNTSVWISDNPPVYGKFIASAFGRDGSFQVEIPLSRFIGKSDCAVVVCAITTRADHTQPDVRSADLFIPVTFKKS